MRLPEALDLFFIKRKKIVNIQISDKVFFYIKMCFLLLLLETNALERDPLPNLILG